MAAEINPALLDEGQMAAFCSVPRQRLRRLVQAGDLPRPIKLGGLERWHRGEVQAWLDRLAGVDVVARVRAAQQKAAMETLNAW